ncbi:antibiotic acetyltransferase [Streptomyces sp. cmx-4-25]|uniref:antibiotic acetyltransferase n=1 Tax=Streptomyces sp. cmx-4-25 TaxID=2790933 RepID=UPI00397E9907
MSPDPTTLHPLPAHDRVVFLKPLITSPNITVGEYTYYDDPDGATEFERRNVLYAYGLELLVIGGYCALATGTRFLMAGAEHPTTGVATYPFTMFGGRWAEETLDIVTAMPSRGDTVVGGNPARPIRQRFDDAGIDRLRRAAWWDWPSGLVTEHARTIMAGTPADIARIAADHALEKPL